MDITIRLQPFISEITLNYFILLFLYFLLQKQNYELHHHTSSASLHSPKSATATMLDRSVSSRRPSPSTAETEPLTSPPSDAASDAVDDSKAKRQHISLLASKYLSRVGQLSPSVIISLFVFLFVASLIFHYSRRLLVCVSPYDPRSLGGPGLFRPDALESDFGYLGVPWCKSASIILNLILM